MNLDSHRLAILTDKEIDAQLERVAKGMKTDAAGLNSLLQKNGIETSSLKQMVAAQIAFSRILAGKYQVKIGVEPAEVDKKYAEIKTEMEQKVSTIMNDPRMKPVMYAAVRRGLVMVVSMVGVLLGLWSRWIATRTNG